MLCSCPDRARGEHFTSCKLWKPLIVRLAQQKKLPASDKTGSIYR